MQQRSSEKCLAASLALRASTQEEAEARARFEQAILSDARQVSEAAHCATRRAVSAEADVAEQSVPPHSHCDAVHMP